MSTKVRDYATCLLPMHFKLSAKQANKQIIFQRVCIFLFFLIRHCVFLFYEQC